MMSKNEKALENLQSIVKPDPGTWKKEAQWRHENKTWLRKSQKIAFIILRALRNQKKTQKELAVMMNVSPQQVNKWVKGKENFTLETLSRLEEALGINLLAINNRDKTTKDNIRFIPYASGINYGSVIQNTVTAYIHSKGSESEYKSFISNYRCTARKFLSTSKENLEKCRLPDFVNKEENLGNWNVYEMKQKTSKIISLNAENSYKKKTILDELLVAEPDEDYY